MADVENVTTRSSSVLAATPETLIISAEHENSSHVTLLQESQIAQQSLSFILVPVIVILCVALFSGVAIYCIQRRQRLDNLRHTLIPLYSFSKDDEDEWGVLLDTSSTSGKGNNNDGSRRESRYSN